MMKIETASDISDRIKPFYPHMDMGMIGEAYDFSRDAHKGHKRESGEAYFTHPVEVATILADMHLDPATIITALLHDVVEDTDISIDMIATHFTEEIAKLVDGVTKLTKMEMQKDNWQTANFGKLILAMSNDIRVLLVKLADRTHNMRTISGIPNRERRERIAHETLTVFAPLARRIGMTGFQNELEDRAFAVVHPEIRQSILSRLEYLTEKSKDIIQDITTELGNVTKNSGVECSVAGRTKTAYSIWRKTQRHGVAIEELSDIMAFRVITHDIDECYRTLGILHRNYRVVPERFKDYISNPKPNNYQSLHTGIIGPLKKKIEVQIKTLEMHAVAERGVAAHWRYKGRDGALEARDVEQFHWLQDLLNILENAVSPDEFLEHTEMEMYADQVFCFTPKGLLIALPKKATAVDFAYAVHSGVGDRCVGAKINGKQRQLATILNNGDQVEILTKAGATPSLEWIAFVATGRARSALRKFMRVEKQKEFARIGKAMLEKAFRDRRKTLREENLTPCLVNFKATSITDLYAMIGEASIVPGTVLAQLYPELRIPKAKREMSKPASGDKKLNIKGLIPGMAVHLGLCCHPLPGEKIIGIITTGKGITVHRANCPVLEKFSTMPELWLDIEWKKEGPTMVTGRVEIVLSNESGSLASITTLISQYDGNIANISLQNRTADFFHFDIDIEVKHVRHFNAILAAMRANQYVESVKRETI